MNFTWKDWAAALRMQKFYENHPRWYALYMGWLAFQSFAAIIIALLIFVGLILATIVTGSVQLGIFTLFCIGSSIFGYVIAILDRPWAGQFFLDKKKYRHVYDKVAEISRKVNGPPIHEIYIGYDFNASVASCFTFTPFRKNVLMLGYPLLCSLSSRGLYGCLMHEIGHLSHNHLSTSTFFYALQSFWANLHLGVVGLVFIPWLRTWFSELNLATLPLYRKHEIEADSYVVQFLGGEYLAACQVEIMLKMKFFIDLLEQEIVPRMHNDDWDECDFAQWMRDLLQENLPADEAETLVERSLKNMNDIFDPHPCFAKRLQLANCTNPMLYIYFQADALEQFIHPDADFYKQINTYLHQITQEKAQEVKSEWNQSLQWLKENPLSDTMDINTINTALDYLTTTRQIQQHDAFVEQCLCVYPENPELISYKALSLAKKEPDQAAILLEQCLSKAPSLYLSSASDFLIEYYINLGDLERLRVFLLNQQSQMKGLRKLAAPDLVNGDNLCTYELPDQVKDILSKSFNTKFKQVYKAYSVKRRLDNQTSMGVVFLVLELKYKWYRLETTHAEMLDTLEEISDYHFIIRKSKFCKRYIQPIPNACFYDRDTYTSPT